MGKDAERYKKIAKDGSLIGECRFSCVASAHVLLNCRFPYECVCIEIIVFHVDKFPSRYENIFDVDR